MDAGSERCRAIVEHVAFCTNDLRQFFDKTGDPSEAEAGRQLSLSFARAARPDANVVSPHVVEKGTRRHGMFPTCYSVISSLVMFARRSDRR